MDKYFTTEQGERVNVVEHTLQQIEKWPNLRIYIATDSQDDRGLSKYATVVVYRYGMRGAHYIYYIQEFPRMPTMYSRLYNEMVFTIETAQMIDSEIPVSFEALEFDYNNIPQWASNKLLSTAKGWAKGLNYNPVFKNSGDNMMIAAKAADHICRR